MGCGKSTIAPILANTLGYNFIDIDTEIEKKTGQKVTDIFSVHGENYFREVEREILHYLSQQTGCVISLGGGTIINESNLQLVKSTGILVYLKVNLQQIFDRMKFKTDRPLLKDKSGNLLTDTELRARINTLIETREQFYEKSDITIVTDNVKVDATIEEIVKQIKHLPE